MRKTQILMNKPVYLGLLVLDLSETVMDEFWYDYVKLWWKCKTLLYGYRQLHCSCKTKIYLGRYCKRCWNKAWHLKFWKNKKVIGLMKMN